MANFATPFAQSAAKRFPDADDKANGFACGPADQPLFNGMFHRIEAELGAVIAAAGLTPTDSDFTQVRQAISALIDAATGGGDTEGYALVTQLTSRLPIFPEVLSADGRLNVTSPAPGTVRAPGGISFLHRGFGVYTPPLTDFATVVSRTYHLRWNPTDGLSLKWTADATYNPGGLPETDAAFDSTYDDMLIARVVTNSSNVATITLLANQARLAQTYAARVTDSIAWTGAPGYAASRTVSHSQDWARTPDYSSIQASLGAEITSGGGAQGGANIITEVVLTRYGTSFKVTTDFDGDVSSRFVEYRVSLAAG